MKGVRFFIFDFGGVIASEGFRDGLKEIGRLAGFDREEFFRTAEELVYGCGYAVGEATEEEFWDRLRQETGVKLSDREMRDVVLTRFVIRPEVLACSDRLRASGCLTAILTDQTNWIEEINASTPFFGRFDRVFNSYRIRLTKRDPEVFVHVCRELNCAPGEAVLIDDNAGHIQRASAMGMNTVLFEGVGDLVHAERMCRDA